MDRMFIGGQFVHRESDHEGYGSSLDRAGQDANCLGRAAFLMGIRCTGVRFEVAS